VLESPGALFSVVGRGFEIITRLGFYWAKISYDCLVGRGEEMVPLRAAQLRNLLCELGPSFVKAGQVRAPTQSFFCLQFDFLRAQQLVKLKVFAMLVRFMDSRLLLNKE